MLKSWRRLSKIFPGNSLGGEFVSTDNVLQKNAKTTLDLQKTISKQRVVSEIDAIKQDIFASSSEKDDGFKLLGELLKHLRETRSMALLMRCRQISRLEKIDNIVYVHSDDEFISQIASNEKYKLELDAFFKQKGLSFRIFEKKKEFSAVDELNQMLGGKLIIK